MRGKPVQRWPNSPTSQATAMAKGHARLVRIDSRSGMRGPLQTRRGPYCTAQEICRFYKTEGVRTIQMLHRGIDPMFYLLSRRIARSRPSMVTGNMRLFISCLMTEIDCRYCHTPSGSGLSQQNFGNALV